MINFLDWLTNQRNDRTTCGSVIRRRFRHSAEASAESGIAETIDGIAKIDREIYGVVGIG